MGKLPLPSSVFEQEAQAVKRPSAQTPPDEPSERAPSAPSRTRASQPQPPRAAGSKFLSTRAPAELGFAVDLAILELGMGGFSCDKGELLAAIVFEHVKTDEKRLASLRRAVEGYRRAFGQ